MAFTTPATFVAGNVLTAAQMNTNVRDNVAWIATDSPAARAYRNASQTLTTAVNTAATLNQERFDNAAVHDTSSNTSRMTVPTGGGGKYLMGGCINFAANAVGVRQMGIWLGGATVLAQDIRSNNGTDTVGMGLVTVYQLAAANYVEMVAFQNSGGDLTITQVANGANEFWVFWYRT